MKRDWSGLTAKLRVIWSEQEKAGLRRRQANARARAERTETRHPLIEKGDQPSSNDRPFESPEPLTEQETHENK